MSSAAFFQNMAGLQNCCRKLLVYNTSRLISKNDIFLQPYRGRHHLVFQISSPQSRIVFQKSKLLFNTDMKQLIYRLASTNVNTTKGIDVNASKPEISETQKTYEAASESVLDNETVVQSSKSSITVDETSLPPVPTPLDEHLEMEFISMGLKEPSFHSLGLGSWWPPGIIQSIYEYLHINLDLPWWQAILLVTITTRLLLFPLTLRVRRNTVNYMNSLPELLKYQQKISDAKTSGDYYGVAIASNELEEFFKEKKINPFGFMKTAVIQGPVFFSMFLALKGMANTPVESLKTGGLFWFTDLTVTDPYYILPALLSTSLLLILELGAEGHPASATTHTIKWALRGLPVIVFFVSMNFSSCITWYWTVANVVSLCQAGVLKTAVVARFFKLPIPIKHDPDLLKRSNKGFIEGFKEGFNNARLTGQIQDRERLNIIKFEKAGKGAIPRTFKRNPLLQKEKK